MAAHLADLDEELESAGSEPVHLVAAGGAAMLSRLPNRVTGDIDIVSEGLNAAVRRACERVAARRGLAADWINDGAKGMAVAVEVQPERIFTGKRLVVDSAGPRYVLAMKLLAGRDGDVEDCVHLIRELGVRSSRDLLDLVDAAVVPRTPPPRVAYWTEEVFGKACRGRLRWKMRTTSTQALSRLLRRGARGSGAA